MPVIAAIGDTGYNVVLLIHIVAAVVGFAPAVAAVLSPRTASADGEVVRAGRMLYTPALIVAGVLGAALVGMSDSVIGFGDAWVSAAFLLWIAVLGVYHAVVIRGAGAEGDAGRRQVVLGSQIIAVLLVALVYLMVFKPGA